MTSHRFVVQEVPILPIDLSLVGASVTSPRPVYRVAGVPSDVFKTAYGGDLFGTGGNYMGG